MRDTFQRNLNQARLKEAAAVEAHEKYLEAMGDALEAMEKSYQSKQGDLAANDASLGKKKEKLAAAVKDKAAAEEFLEKLLEMCAAKAKEYDERTMLRAQEQAAIAEAIAILNSDAAFESFGKVKATSKEGKFLQLKSINSHSSDQDVRMQTARKLRQSKAWSNFFLAKVASLLQAENPFAVVTAEMPASHHGCSKSRLCCKIWICKDVLLDGLLLRWKGGGFEQVINKLMSCH